MIHELVAKAAADCERADDLERHLLSEQVTDAERQLATALMISCAADPGTDMPWVLLDVVVELARQASPGAVRAEISQHTATLLRLASTGESELQTVALQVLGHGLPDAQLAATLADIDDETAQLAAACLDPARLATLRSPVTAVLAARELGQAPTGALAVRLASALVTNPDALYELSWPDNNLDDLLAFLASHRVTTLAAITAPTAPAELRREAARAVRHLHPADDLTVFIGQMLDDPDDLVRREALRTVCRATEHMAPYADRVAQLLDDTPKNRRLAIGGLLFLGDPRWQAAAPRVIRDGLAFKQLIQAIDGDNPGEELRAAVAERIAALLTAAPPQPMHTSQELSSLLKLARRWHDRAVIPALAQALPTTDPINRLAIGRALADLGEGDPAAVEALRAAATDDLYFGYLAHQAGADPDLMREALLATNSTDIQATLLAADLFGETFPGIIERLEWLRDEGPSLKNRLVGASVLFHLMGRQPPAGLVQEALANLTGRDAQHALNLARQTGMAP